MHGCIRRDTSVQRCMLLRRWRPNGGAHARCILRRRSRRPGLRSTLRGLQVARRSGGTALLSLRLCMSATTRTWIPATERLTLLRICACICLIASGVGSLPAFRNSFTIACIIWLDGAGSAGARGRNSGVPPGDTPVALGCGEP